MVVGISVIIFSWVRQAVELTKVCACVRMTSQLRKKEILWFQQLTFHIRAHSYQKGFPIFQSLFFFAHNLTFAKKNIVVEHTLSLSVAIFRSISCTNNTKFEASVFYKQAWPQIYTIIKYDGGVRGFSGELVNYYSVLQWVFMDILLIAITICLSTRLHQLNQHLKQYNGMVKMHPNRC